MCDVVIREIVRQSAESCVSNIGLRRAAIALSRHDFPDDAQIDDCIKVCKAILSAPSGVGNSQQIYAVLDNCLVMATVDALAIPEQDLRNGSALIFNEYYQVWSAFSVCAPAVLPRSFCFGDDWILALFGWLLCGRTLHDFNALGRQLAIASVLGGDAAIDDQIEPSTRRAASLALMLCGCMSHDQSSANLTHALNYCSRILDLSSASQFYFGEHTARVALISRAILRMYSDSLPGNL